MKSCGCKELENVDHCSLCNTRRISGSFQTKHKSHLSNLIFTPQKASFRPCVNLKKATFWLISIGFGRGGCFIFVKEGRIPFFLARAPGSSDTCLLLMNCLSFPGLLSGARCTGPRLPTLLISLPCGLLRNTQNFAELQWVWQLTFTGRKTWAWIIQTHLSFLGLSFTRCVRIEWFQGLQSCN